MTFQLNKKLPPNLEEVPMPPEEGMELEPTSINLDPSLQLPPSPKAGIGERLAAILSKLDNSTQGVASNLFGGMDEPSDMDYINAEKEPAMGGGILNALSRLNQTGSRARIGKSQRAASDAAEQSKLDYQASQMRANDALVGQRNATADLTKSKVGIDKQLAGVKEAALKLQGETDRGKLAIQKGILDDRLEQTEISLQNAETERMKVTDLNSRETIRLEFEAKKLEFQKARDAVEALYKSKLGEAAATNAASGVTRADALQTAANSETTTEETTPGIEVISTEGAEPQLIPESLLEAIKKDPKSPMSKTLLKALGYEDPNIFGFGGKEPSSIKPVSIPKSKTVTKSTQGSTPKASTPQSSGTLPPQQLAILLASPSGTQKSYANGQTWENDNGKAIRIK